ncbi:MAG TPA: cyclic nucleotide-binding domain-containing protein [Chitinispirillaceae bacterium]|nr:cyclic nucleotide-binding domain-containing protein [Chitinispirillaceae bacterium]
MKIFRSDNYAVPAFLLAFIFCGAVVGETVSISLIVSSAGSRVLSKLYLINGVLLLGLPLLFFNNIDRVERGKMLSVQLLSSTAILFSILVLLTVSLSTGGVWDKYVLLILYPFSYLSKTTLFLTFWTLSNDIFTTSESKKAFPLISAWGFAGGLAGACLGRVLIEVAPVELVLVVWTMSYAAAWLFAVRARKRFSRRLLVPEEIHESSSVGILENVESVLTSKLVRLIAVLYFFIFIAVFSIDYLFWNKCHIWFSTSSSIASFQFSFYLIHALVTLAGLWFVLPGMISRLGFSRILYALPMVFAAGAVILLIFYKADPGRSFFTVFVVVQFFRYVTFENAFSPIYQMFFAAIEKERRGRAKTLLDGFVKPLSIIASGLILILIGSNTELVLILISVCGIVLLFTVTSIRRTYSRSLIPSRGSALDSEEIFRQLVGWDNERLWPLIRDYSRSEEADMRMVSVKLIASSGTAEAFDELVKMYDSERDLEIKQLISRSMERFFSYRTRFFMERLLKEPELRIRANALYSLNRMNCNWKRHLKPLIRQLLFENSIRVQIEAACFLWNGGDPRDRENVRSFLGGLLESTNPNRRSAGLYLIGLLKPPDWGEVLVDNLTSSSLQVFRKSIEIILRSGAPAIRYRALQKVQDLGREHIAITGEIIDAIGAPLWDTLIGFLPQVSNRRMFFEIVRCLRLIADSIRSSGKAWSISADTSDTIQSWITTEIESIYRDCFVWNHFRKSVKVLGATSVLDGAIRENLIRFCEWAVNAMILMDKKGVLSWRHNDIDIREREQRFDLIEIIESSSYQRIGSLVLPLLKFDSWEYISKTGKNHFHFKDETANNGLLYFINSDNRWLCFCGLYTYWLVYGGRPVDPAIEEALRVLVDDPSPQVSIAARELIESRYKSDSKKVQAFEYLERVLFFKKSSLFKNVNAEKLLKLAEITQEEVFEKGSVISAQGQISDHLYLVKKGSLRVVKNVGAVKTVLATVREGETYGEIGLFTQATRSASAIANERCELYVIKRGQFKKLLLEIPDISYSLLEVLSERLKKSGEEMVEIKNAGIFSE